jgi:hypothetical protein
MVQNNFNKGTENIFIADVTTLCTETPFLRSVPAGEFSG